MAKTLSEMTFSVIEQASGFNITDDNEYPEDLVADILVSVNSTLIREAFRNRTLDESLYLSHENVPILEISNDIEIEGVTVKNNQHLKYASIPYLITGIGDRNLIYFGTSDFSSNFSRKRFQRLINQLGIVFKLSNVSYSVIGNKAYFLSTEVQGMSIVSAIGLWNDPRLASSYDPEMPFPTPSDYKMELLALQQLLQTKNVPYDIVNDGQRQIIQPRQREEAR
jgi:hypothetical protein